MMLPGLLFLAVHPSPAGRPEGPVFPICDVKVNVAPKPGVEVQNQVVRPEEPTPRADENSRIAHRQLLDKKAKGRIDVYFVGDSITRRWGTSDAAYKNLLANWNANFFGWNAANFGWGGDGTQHILWRLHHGELDGVNPKVIVVLAGTNNIGSDDPPAIAKGIEAIVALCRRKAPEATVLLTAVLPRTDRPDGIAQTQEVNRLIRKLTDAKMVRWIDIGDRLLDDRGKFLEGVSTDGLHLAVRGYQTWADALKPHLAEILGPPAKTDSAPPPTGDPNAGGGD